MSDAPSDRPTDTADAPPDTPTAAGSEAATASTPLGDDRSDQTQLPASTERVTAVPSDDLGDRALSGDAGVSPPRSLSQRLLFDPPRPPPPPSGARWAARLALTVLGAVFFIYYSLVLIAHNIPSQGPTRDIRAKLLGYTQGSKFLTMTGTSQNWSMFAPNPNRTNGFVRVLVTDQDDNVWDVKHDIWGDDRYPYVFYDRIGKINRRLDNKQSYQQLYGAWVCRDWERKTGKPAKRVRFVRRATRVPEPGNVPKKARAGRWGYYPWKLPYTERAQQTIECATAVNGQIPNYLRARYGMPLAPEDAFVPGNNKTWRDRFYKEIEIQTRIALAAGERAALGLPQLGGKPKNTKPIPRWPRG